jgi:hypothetical protein
MKFHEPHGQSENGMSGNDQVRVEIEVFLQALSSYPARFAADPRMTFEEYRASLMPISRAAAAGAQRGSAFER